VAHASIRFFSGDVCVRLAHLRETRAAANCLLCLACCSLLTMAGCQPESPLERAGIVLKPPTAWQPKNATAWMVPGTPISAWSGPDGSSLVVYRSLRVPAASAEMLAEALGNRLENLPDLRLLVKRSEITAGIPAARVEVVAPGTGDCLAASGLGKPIEPAGRTLNPTRQVTLAFSRPGDTIYLTWHMPEESYERIEPQIRSTLQSLRIDSRRKTPPRND
jgi:hypothetical protein